MNGDIKSAMEGVYAEDRLKADTLHFLHREIQKRSRIPHRHRFRKYAAALAAVILFMGSGTYVYQAYTTPAAYVDVDVNPSIALTLNRFDRVISVSAYNEEDASAMQTLALKHKAYGDALAILLDSITGQGYMLNGGLVSVTLQTANKRRENALLDNIQRRIEDYLDGHHQAAEVDVFPVSKDVRSYSYAQGVSPAKYLAIQALIAVDATASVENCRGHSIREIKELTQAHSAHHGEEIEPTLDKGNGTQSGEAHTEAESSSAQEGGHGEGKRHHGGGHD